MKKILGTLIITIVLLVSGVNVAFAATTTHSVKKGETLYTISKTYKVSVNNLKTWNKLTTDKIKTNQKLAVAAPAKKEKSKTPSRSNDKVTKEITVSASAFTANCNGCSGITSSGINLKKNPDVKVIAVDPSIIPIGTKVHVEGYGYAIAGDTGGAIKGNKIDVFFPTKNEAYKWGRKNVTVKILE
ncbi:MAG: 3D domain-containing protein [Psychrobacillus sp.]|uniref:LysM peptidoglycan-binding and 3D domain-containing protein n=1 Tax=Psychrobacillus sp. MER TA 171 TaxID=2939577 RepID=UPI00204009B9|nr:LysM peptidoglycan-binding and 3D domain-containing protein [Psychrobacillus sp. MER TA 171]MCM3359496.1 3D domain-containing protein [Psychrobacillus sp. MER TA 171]